MDAKFVMRLDQAEKTALQDAARALSKETKLTVTMSDIARIMIRDGLANLAAKKPRAKRRA